MSIAPPRNPVPRKVWARIKAHLALYGVGIDDGPNVDVQVIDDEDDEFNAFAVLYCTKDVPQPVVLNKEPLRLPGDQPVKEA